MLRFSDSVYWPFVNDKVLHSLLFGADNCVTVTAVELTTDAEKVTVVTLELVDVFALLVETVTEPLPEPLVGDTVSQAASSETLQLVFDVTEIFPADPEAEPSLRLVGDTDKVADVPDCVTVTVVELTPDAEKVTVATLELVDVFALLVETVTEPLPEPLVGDTVSQAASSETLQLVFDVTEIFPADPEADPTLRLVGDTDKVADVPDCVTVTVAELTPYAEKVTVAALALVHLFALLV